MGHLALFSHNYHSIFKYGKSSYYNDNKELLPATTTVNGVNRQLDVYTDIQDSTINFSGSAFRSYYYPAIEYNNSNEFKENVSNHVDLSGLSVRHAFLNHYACSTADGFNECSYGIDTNGNKLEKNLDNWNFEQYPIVFITPRHAIMPSHPYDYCNQGRQKVDQEDFSCCVAQDGTCTNEAFYATMYERFIWMNKNNNQIIYPFSSYSDFKAKLQARDTVNGVRIRNLRQLTPQNGYVDCMLVEFPSDIATPANGIKYYNKLIYTNAIPVNIPVYRVRGSGIVYKQYYTLNSFNQPMLASYSDGINDSCTECRWTGDSGSPILINYDNDTVFAGTTDCYVVNQLLKNHIFDFISAGNKPEYKDLLVFFDIQSPPIAIDGSDFFGNALESSPLEQDPYLSRFRSSEKDSKNDIAIAFIPGNALQASELNQLQEMIVRDNTLSYKFLSKMTIESLSNNGKLFRGYDSSPENPLDLTDSLNYKFYMIPYSVENISFSEVSDFYVSGPSISFSYFEGNIIFNRWVAIKKKCGLFYYAYILPSGENPPFYCSGYFNSNISNTLNNNGVYTSYKLADYRSDPSILDSVSNFYGASRLRIIFENIANPGQDDRSYSHIRHAERISQFISKYTVQTMNGVPLL